MPKAKREARIGQSYLEWELSRGDEAADGVSGIGEPPSMTSTRHPIVGRRAIENSRAAHQQSKVSLHASAAENVRVAARRAQRTRGTSFSLCAFTQQGPLPSFQ